MKCEGLSLVRAHAGSERIETMDEALFDNLFNKLLKWLVFILFQFFFGFSPGRHPLHKLTNWCVFLFGENQAGEGRLAFLSWGHGGWGFYYSSVLFQGETPKKIQLLMPPQKKLEWSSSKTWPSSESFVWESPGCACEFFRNKILFSLVLAPLYPKPRMLHSQGAHE